MIHSCGDFSKNIAYKTSKGIKIKNFFIFEQTKEGSTAFSK